MSKATGLTESCWPVFEFLTNFVRLVNYGGAPQPEQARFEAVSALRDAEDQARNDSAVERLWSEQVKAILVYTIDYKMLNTDWDGRDHWFNNLLETDREVLNHAEALGGEEFFRACDELQREYELAERRERKDRFELAELLSLYFICLRLGFKGQFHDRPQELADYTRRLFSRLPAYATTRAREMFPDAYKQTEEVKVNYNLGLSLTVVLVTFAVILGVWLAISRIAWKNTTDDIHALSRAWAQGIPQVSAEPADTEGGQ